MGIVLIEAQANGLYSLASDRVPHEADLGLNLFNQKSLKNSPKEWAVFISNKFLEGHNRKAISNSNNLFDYDIKSIAKRLEKFYLHCTEV